MNTPARQLSQSHDVAAKVTQVVQSPHEAGAGAFRRACEGSVRAAGRRGDGRIRCPPGRSGPAGRSTRSTSRSVRFCCWDTLRQRGNNFIEHERQGLPPVLHFDYEMVMDGRSFERPVNYALLRIVPPKGVTVDAKRRPYVIIDPRGGHGPGIGGFKDDSQVGVALQRRPPGVLRDLLPESRTGTDAARRVQRRARVRASRARASPRRPEARNRRQLPGRLGRDDAGRRQSRRHRSGRDRRRADVLLGRRLERRRGRQPDALRRRAARRHLARIADLRPRRGHLRRRLAGAELREPEPGQHLLGQVLPGVRRHRHRVGALSRVRALVGWLLPAQPRGDRVDHAEPVRRQQAVVRHGEVPAPAAASTCARSRCRSCCSRRWATTSRRRSRPSTGSPTSTAAPRKSRPAGR